MTRLISAVVLLVALAAPAWAGFDEGVAAYKRGDYATALREMRPLAEQGFAPAQYNLGIIYGKGFGGPQDYVEAAKWHRKAAEQGLASAQYNLGIIYRYGLGVPQDYAEAVRWYRKAAMQGDALAQLNLGVMYGTGKGVVQNYVRAHKWYNLAASQTKESDDRDLATKNRDIVAKKMTPADISKAQRLASEWWERHGKK